MRSRVVFFLWLALSTLACGLSDSAPTPTHPLAGAVGDSTLAPVVTMTSAPVYTTATPPDTLTVEPELLCESSNKETPLARYEVEAQIDTETYQVKVAMRLTYHNRTGKSLSQIVLNIDTNRAPGVFLLDNLTAAAGAALAGYTLEDARLEINLVTPLRTGCAAAFDLSFSLQIPELTSARARYFSHTSRQLNLGYWLPEAAPYIEGVWRTPQAGSVGEYTYSELGDFQVRVKVRGDTSLILIAPGEVRQVGDGEWSILFRQGRSFTLSLSNKMSLLNARTKDGLLIDLYHFIGEGISTSAPKHALQVAVEAAELYTRLFGKLPYSRIVVVEADFFDGMEFSGIVYVGTGWFSGYQGRLTSWLTLITAHEVAHQWYYSLVTNDQGAYPYLDEAIAIYCELLYMETKTPVDVQWWWLFRVKQLQPKGYVDSAVYEYQAARPYINAVYLRGASMFQEIRDLIGDEAFFKWWQDYLKASQDRIATPADFWGALPPELYLKTSEIRLNYLRDYDPLRVEKP